MKSGNEETQKFAKRFDGRADSYSKYRPRYPGEVVDRLRSEIGFTADDVVADLASGTGILSELFLKNGNLVYAVEPNKEMRAIAERNLAGYKPRFVSLEGWAEATGLGDRFVDLVAVGQALHWLDVDKTRAEFRRILAKDGTVAILYNTRRKESAAEKGYESLQNRFQVDLGSIVIVDDVYVRNFLAGGPFSKHLIPHSQRLDQSGLLGLLASASYMPRPGSGGWTELERESRKVFDENKKDGQIELWYDTELYIGKFAD